MLFLTYTILFFLGLGIGSFFNVVAFRYDAGKPLFSFSRLGGRSKCPHCHKILRWFELMPILSFVLQRGLCRSCHRAISPQYPLVELVAGLTFAGLPFYLDHFYRASFLGAFWLLVFLVLLLISAIDLRHFLIPNGLVFALVLLGFGVMAVKTFYSSDPALNLPISFLGHYSRLFSFPQIWLNHLLGALLPALVFAALVYFSKEKAMGWGDVKLGAALGLLLGLPDIIMATALSFLIGGLAGLGLILSGRRTMESHLPFGPFLALGAVAVFFFGSKLLEFYFSIFSK